MATVTVRGLVTDEVPRPLAGVRIELGFGAWNAPSLGVTTTAEDGTFAMALPRASLAGQLHRGELRAIATLVGRAPNEDWIQLPWPPPDEVAFEIVLGRGTWVEGRVVDERDRPVPGASVRWNAPKGVRSTLETDAHGRYCISLSSFQLEAQSRIELEASRPDVGRATGAVSTWGGDPLVAPTLVLRPTDVLAGRVECPEGRGIEGLSVSARAGSAKEATWVVTDANGAFRFASLEPGVYAVSLTGSEDAVRAATGTSSLVLRPARPLLCVAARTAEGLPLLWADVELWREEEDGSYGAVAPLGLGLTLGRTTAPFDTAFPTAERGRFLILIDRPPYPPVERLVALDEPCATRREIRVDPPGQPAHLELVLPDPRGKPLEGWHVELRSLYTNRVLRRLEVVDGGLEAAPPGRYRGVVVLSATGEDGPELVVPVEEPLVLEAGRTTRIAVEGTPAARRGPRAPPGSPGPPGDYLRNE